MNLSLSFRRSTIDSVKHKVLHWPYDKITVIIAALCSIAATTYFFLNDKIIAYGDAESHLNISKRVVAGLTPGFAQLGGIWLPLPHLMMLPFVYFDVLWRTGLAGSIVSGFCFIVAALFIYKTILFLTNSRLASFAGALIFICNPNVLYMQTTPMTELPLIMFFVLSGYFFIKFISHENELLSLILAGFFGFCASLTRYDGWFLVFIEALIIFVKFFPYKKKWQDVEGRVLLFSTLAFFGILIWFIWGFIILGDPLYFTHSQFSAKSQQASWLSKGELPGYHNILMSIAYYLITAMSNSGVVVFAIATFALAYFVIDTRFKYRWLIVPILLVPIIFNVITLYLGQSVIFIPSLTPVGYEWRLFNVRYGIMMVPIVALLFGYFIYRIEVVTKIIVISLCLIQALLFISGYSKIITLEDGVVGLSHAKRTDAEFWMTKNYDHGLVLIDDYARTMSIIRSGIPMQNVIYIGTKPYWEDSLKQPEKYATWIVMQKDDVVWRTLYDDKAMQARLYKYFKKTYTSNEILIFKRNSQT